MPDIKGPGDPFVNRKRKQQPPPAESSSSYDPSESLFSEGNESSFIFKMQAPKSKKRLILPTENEMDSQESDVESSSGISRPETPTPIYPNDDSDTTHLYTDDSEPGSPMNTSTPLADEDIPSENEELQPIPAPQPSKPHGKSSKPVKKDTSGSSKSSLAPAPSSASNNPQHL